MLLLDFVINFSIISVFKKNLSGIEGLGPWPDIGGNVNETLIDILGNCIMSADDGAGEPGRGS